MEKSRKGLKGEAKPRHYYKFPAKVFFGLSLGIIGLSVLVIIAVWYAVQKDGSLNASASVVTTFFSGVLACAILLWITLGAMQPERRNRFISILFGLVFVLFIAGIITFFLNVGGNAGRVVITLALVAAMVMSIYAIISPRVKVSRPAPSSRDVTKEFTNSGKTTARYEKEAEDATSSIIQIG